MEVFNPDVAKTMDPATTEGHKSEYTVSFCLSFSFFLKFLSFNF